MAKSRIRDSLDAIAAEYAQLRSELAAIPEAAELQDFVQVYNKIGATSKKFSDTKLVAKKFIPGKPKN